MKVILLSIGTRGDMEPFLAIGELLKEKGCRVICAFPEQFGHLTEDADIEFASLGSKFIELLESDDGRKALGGSGSGLKKMLAYARLALRQTEINKELVHKQRELIERENPDRIVYNGKAIYPIIWGLENKGNTVLVSPVPYVHYVKDNTHVAFNSNFGPVLNKLTYSIANFGLVTTVRITVKWLKMTEKITRKQIRNALQLTRVIYTISPSLFPRPVYWKENLKVLGYQERTQATKWKPDKGLTDFLGKHNRILFVTFGSMTNPEPEAKTRIILDVLEQVKIPAIINTASGGLVKLQKHNTELIHFVSGIPYGWIFPRSHAVIHHGGSGTTQLALKYGCATMIIPHIIDQFVWNRIIHKLGAGPKGIRINKITTKNLEPKILELVNNASFKKKAERIATRMKKENFSEEIYKSIIVV
jgi:UDP:flavonoid glycosyltransferase YjiC (YdhE family)